MTRFELRTAIAASPQRVFDTALQVETHTTGMATSGEQVIGDITSGQMALGDTVTWQARHLGLRWRMTARISACVPPNYFVDEQVTGPFKHWRHDHRFEPDGNGGTVMLDIVDFTAPFRPLGTVAELTVLNWYMPRLIRVRNDHLKTVAETAR